ncbi:hypothetical protein CF386_08160 [Paraphotobacterium marinum]|uniref:Uncharacterized protein n=1 Tax=Paraphotobacterium marinum TaxID=1755811 RepID=A0A220VFS1_9GAMM|nr:hypothetical protein CF386_08160 [Paraphotobacterium marinum]
MQKKGLFLINSFIVCGLLISTVTKSEQCNLYAKKKIRSIFHQLLCANNSKKTLRYWVKIEL